MGKYIAVIEKAENNYSAYLPDVPGCVSTGDTVDETLQNIKEALEFHLETLQEDGDTLPLTSSLEKHLANGDIALEDDVIIAYIHAAIPEKQMAL